MAHSDVSICSRALILLGARPISSLEEDTDAARVCNAVYGPLRDAIIAAHPWRFAMKKAALSLKATAPVNEWSYAFVIPGEAVAGGVHAVFASASDRRAISDYEIFQRDLYANVSQVWADYKIVPPEAVWPETFVRFMTYAVAADIAFAITDQQNSAEAWNAKAYGLPGENGLGGALGEALALEAQGQGNSGIFADAFVDARAGGV